MNNLALSESVSKAAAFSSDVTMLAVGGHNDSGARTFEVTTGRLVRTFSFSKLAVDATLFLANSSDVVLSDNASKIKLFNAVSGSERNSFGL